MLSKGFRCDIAGPWISPQLRPGEQIYQKQLKKRGQYRSWHELRPQCLASRFAQRVRIVPVQLARRLLSDARQNLIGFCGH
jgi:hypothetical protein